MGESSERAVIRCPKCGLNQFAADRCRRCGCSFLEGPKPLQQEKQQGSSGVEATTVSVFAWRLLQARNMRGLTQEQLAARMNIARTFVSKIENGRTTYPFLKTIYRFAEALSIHPMFFVEEDYIVALAVVGLPAMDTSERAAILAWCERHEVV